MRYEKTRIRVSYLVSFVSAIFFLLTPRSQGSGDFFAQLSNSERKEISTLDSTIISLNQSLELGAPILSKKIKIPADLLIETEQGHFGGDIRLGDLTGNGQADFIVYRAVDNFHDGGGMKPCFLGAFTSNGRVLWNRGKGGLQPGRPGPVTIHDIDNDGKTEVICFFQDSTVKCPPTSMENVVIQIRDGASGDVEIESSPEELRRCWGSGPNWAHQRILIANLRGNAKPSDFVVKLGENLLAFDQNLNILWKYKSKWKQYSICPAYIPSVGDIDGDGKDEVNGGYFLIDQDGRVMWEHLLGRHMDSVAIAPWDNGKMRAFCSGFGHVMDEEGNVVLKLGEGIVPHGQELRVGRFDKEIPGPQLMIRYKGHSPDVLLVNIKGEVVRRFKLNPCPNNTGMEAVYWYGPEKPALIYNGGMLWDGKGRKFAILPGLSKPFGNQKQGWHHCIPANLCGDEREELVVYNPWEPVICIYTPAPLEPEKYTGYQPGPRQYNARLMD